MALGGLQAERQDEEPRRSCAGAAKDDIVGRASVLLAGPGAISTVIVYESQAQGLGQTAMVYNVIAAVGVLSYAVFWRSQGRAA